MENDTRGIGAAIGGVVLTGLLAGLAVGMGLLISAQLPDRDTRLGGLVAVVGVVGCLILLGLTVSPLARSAGDPQLAVVTPLATAALLPVAYMAWISLLSGPFESAFCAGQEDTFCGLGVLIFVPTYGSLLVWASAAAPPLLMLVFRTRRQRIPHDGR